MSGTTSEGIQPVSEFLPQKPQTDSMDNPDLNPVTQPETTLPGFPSEAKVDAPAVDVNAQNFEQNAQVCASSGEAAAAPSTNGVSLSATESQINGNSTEINKDSSLPTTDSLSVPPLPEPQRDSLPTQDSSSAPTQQTSLDLPTQLSPPLEQQPISDMREVPEPLPQESETAQRIISEKHQQDVSADPELAQALSTEGEAPIQTSVATTISEALPLQPNAGIGEADSLKTDDVMDTTADGARASSTVAEAAGPTAATNETLPQPDSLTLPTEQPAAPAPTPALPPQQSTSADQTMPDALPTSIKVARERDEDSIELEPASKRAKTEVDSVEPEFKVPPVPQTSSPAPMSNAAATGTGEQMTLPRVKALNRALQSAKKVQCSRFYKLPVDPIAMNIPTYPDVIKNPMDLSTVEKKLKAIPCQYETVPEFMDDIKLMVSNAARFNGPEHIVAKEGRDLQDRIAKEINSLPPAEFEEPSKAEKKAQKIKIEPSRSIPARRQSIPTPGPASTPPAATATQTFALNPDGVPLIRRDSNVVDGRPKRAIHPPKRNEISGGRPKKKKFEWQLKFCREALNELKKPKHYNYAQYFYYPVDPVALNIPSYHSVIKKPMDLGTVENKLNNNEYEKAKDFEEDVRQIFKNCFKFNIKGDLVFGAGEQTLKVFDDKWATKQDWLDDHEPTSEPATPASDSEEEEEEQEDEDDSEAERNEKLQLLQKQIELMSKQMGELANAKKKKKTPPVATKKAKKSKKDGKASFPALSGKKDKKSKKPEKERFVTYNEKQYISMGISTLPDNRMSEALRIIQSNVPALKNTHETEIELDIDELPNHVLLKLLSFVKRYVPQAPPEPEPEPKLSSYAGGASSSVIPSSGKPKKNKPMSKHEQEAQIEELKGRLGRYGDGGQMSPDPVQSIEQGDSSGDESDSEESEEE